MARIAFIGLGNMGGPMSINLVKAGHQVRGYDIVAEKTARAAAGGVEAATSNPDAAKDADFVFTMLPTGKEVREVLVDIDKVMDVVGPGTIIVDSSTTDLGATDYIHTQADQTRADTDRFPGLRRHGGRRGRHADLHGGRRRGCHRPRRASVSGHGKTDGARRRAVRRTGRESMQQHAARHFHGRRLRSHSAGRSRRASTTRYCST